MYIKDFVSSNKLVPNDFEEKELFASEGAASIVMRTPTYKIRPENVTVPQWVSANMRIVSALLERGDIANRQQLLEYIKYTEEIGEYFQIYSIPSVMLYDHRYREKQAKENIPWRTSMCIPLITIFVHPSTQDLLTRTKLQFLLKEQESQAYRKIKMVKIYAGITKLKMDVNVACGVQIQSCMHVCNENHPEYLHKLIKGK